jgi:pimeloyl-ACP methyl ester carboxylesterase
MASFPWRWRGRPLAEQPLSTARDRSLVVLLHAYRHTPGRLAAVEKAVREFRPDAHVIVPALPLQMWSTADLNDVAADVVALIDTQVEHRREQLKLGAFEQIVLVGHSTGSMIARKAYVIACGETADAPFEHRDQSSTRPLREPMPWAGQVKRIIQLAGMNGGWSVTHHMGVRRAFEFSVGSAAGHLVAVTGRQLAIFQIRRGAPFLSGLRLQWLALQQQADTDRRQMALVVQLLGTVDDLVAPEDNLDLVTGREFVYLDVKFSGHVNVIEMDAPDAGPARREAFRQALVTPRDALKAESVSPSDHDAIVSRSGVGFTDVIFVVHGIRDAGFWTHKIARRVQALGKKCRPPRIYATETSTYGYFPMLSFLLPWRRRDKVAWLMDQYARAKSLYPNATRFAYLGHSNGTYLLAAALRDNPACRFERVVFAGSVVRRDYNWAEAQRRGQVGTLLNYVATNDKVVACFPGALERLPWQDLGSAGHNGFARAPPGTSDSGVLEVRFVEGGHSAALSEEQWDDIALFICEGKNPLTREGDTPKPWHAAKQTRSVVFLGRYPWILWAAIIALLSLVTFGIWQIPFEWLRVLALIGFGWAVVKILTRF